MSVSRCSPRAGTPTPSRTSSACAPSGRQLLCEQVVGRGSAADELRRQRRGLFEPEYAEVYGVPFSFIPQRPARPRTQPGPYPTRVPRPRRPHRLRDHFSAAARLPLRHCRTSGSTRRFTDDSQLALSTRRHSRPRRRTPPSSAKRASTRSTTSSATGPTKSPSCWPSSRWKNTSAGRTSRPSADGAPLDADVQAWLFPQLLAIAKRWLASA